MKLTRLAHMLALIGAVSPAMAQDTPPQTDPSMQRVEITGSSIKRIVKEGALPIQVITFDQMQKQGITSADQLVRIISSNGTGADNAVSGNNVFGADADRVSGGGSFASLRGLGPNSTLVLLNGRRIATQGSSGKAVDLNAIPLAAVSRVEILKDGASAIYGTDAVGGVINFILRTDYQGVEVALNDNFTEQGGGATRRASLLAGKGDIDKDKFNVMASLTIDHNDSLAGTQRSFNNGYQPTRGLSPDTTGTPFANQLTGAGTALGTGFKMPGDPTTYLQAGLLSLQNKCNSVPGMMQYDTALWKDVTAPSRSTYSCAYDYGADYVMQLPVDRSNFVSRGTIQFAPDQKAFVEVLASRTDGILVLTPAQISTSLSAGNAYPVGGAYYQDLSAYIPSFDKTKPIIYKWRATPLGNRTQEIVSDNMHILVGLDGSINSNWDYKLGLSHARSKTNTDLIDGYAYTSQLYAALGTGKINPWLAPGQTQTAEAMQLINASKFVGGLQEGTTTLTQLDGSVSGKLYKMPAGDLDAAVGFDFRREGYEFTQYTDATKILLAPGNASLPEASRDIKAVYAEMIVPIMSDLEAQIAVRRDQYSVIGSTTNPKLALRYQPTNWLLFRGSANKSFLAPSFSQLYSGSLLQELPNGADDPLNCPSHPGDTRYCSIPRIQYTSGGNANLKPQTAKQGSIGVVIEPVKGYSASFDFWDIKTQNLILNRTPQVVLANYQSLASDIIRNADGTINYVQAGWINAAGSKLRGVDVGLRAAGAFGNGYKWAATLDGTYLDSFLYHEFDDQPYVEYVGKFFTRDLYLRWKHNATFSVTKGDWSAVLSQNFSSGYKDELPDGGKAPPPAGFNPDVASYTLFGLSGSYTGIKNTTITVGIQNLLNTDPPFTAHNVDEVVGAGWDPRVADPRGRAIWFELKYKFL